MADTTIPSAALRLSLDMLERATLIASAVSLLSSSVFTRRGEAVTGRDDGCDSRTNLQNCRDTQHRSDQGEVGSESDRDEPDFKPDTLSLTPRTPVPARRGASRAGRASRCHPHRGSRGWKALLQVEVNFKPYAIQRLSGCFYCERFASGTPCIFLSARGCEIVCGALGPWMVLRLRVLSRG